jgi:type 1 glutamine amidotransferase
VNQSRPLTAQRRQLNQVILFLVAALAVSRLALAADATRVLIVVGPSTHPPGSHEVAAGGRVIKHCVEHMANVPGVRADLVSDWPQDQSLRDAASTIVFIGDIFPPNRFPEAKRNLAELDAMMRRGCGIVCLHYATGLRAEDVAEDGEHPLLHWMGGYFATRCKHHQSVARVYPAATITPATPQHPVSRGWKEFTLPEEPYTNNYFGKNNNQPEANVTVLATSLLPPESPKREAVAWAVERADGGRGFGAVMLHFFKNWAQEDLRRFILNGIVWSAKLDVPAEGVKTTLPELASFKPDAVEFVSPPPRPPKQPKKAASNAQPR